MRKSSKVVNAGSEESAVEEGVSEGNEAEEVQQRELSPNSSKASFIDISSCSGRSVV